MAIAINGSAARRFLARVPADIDEVAANLDRIINDSRRASEVFDSILALFRREDQEREPIDINKIALEVLQSSRGELADRRVTTRTELASGSRPLMAALTRSGARKASDIGALQGRRLRSFWAGPRPSRLERLDQKVRVHDEQTTDIGRMRGGGKH